MRPHRRKIQLIFQDPFASLNPRMTVGEILAEPLMLHDIVPARARETGWPNCCASSACSRIRRRATRTSSRAASASASSSPGRSRSSPKVIVCDEAVSALDVSIRAQILNLLKDLQARLGARLHLHLATTSAW